MIRRRTVVVGFALLLVACGWWLWSPLWLSDAALQSWVEHVVPIGTDIARARGLIRSSGWALKGEWEQSEPSIDFGTRKGSHVIYAYLGHRRLVFREDVDAFFGFDRSGRLVEIHIRRMTDAL
jgi:hypothetical protein